ncbi:MAG: protein kinase family protein [Chloroflexi bacterium]|nr:protein kinase family protein [Chloroflexota bacterium]
MFNPDLRTQLLIEDQTFTFAPHPVVPSLVWGQEGRHAIVFRVESGGESYALKVFRPVFRHPGLIEAADAISIYADLPGMRVCRQTVLTEDSHPDVVAQHEDLNFSMLMPWIEGETWFDFLQQRKRTTLDQSRVLAESMSWVLYALELNNLAHCDLSSGNVILEPSLKYVHLIDVEDLYTPHVAPPPFVPTGSIGYAHYAAAKTGQWGPVGDRFAGALLLAEMLGWAKPEIRKMCWGESYFDPKELQDPNSERYIVLRDMLRVYDPGFAETFEQVWRSANLERCPPLKTWYDLLDMLPREPVAEWAPIDPALLAEETPPPAYMSAGLPQSKSTATGPTQDAKPQRAGCRGCMDGCLQGCRQLVTTSLLGIALTGLGAALTIDAVSGWPLLSQLSALLF